MSIASDMDRFLDKVSPEPNTGCWLWIGGYTGKRKKLAYGLFGVNRRMRLAHRWLWELTNGPIPEGYHLDHKCRVTECVNPRHLRCVTPQENFLAPGSLHAGAKTHCGRGHAFTLDNTYLYKGWRYCRECDRLRHYLKKRSL